MSNSYSSPFSIKHKFIAKKTNKQPATKICGRYTSLGGTLSMSDAAKKISGAGFRFSNASADTIASNLIHIK